MSGETATIVIEGEAHGSIQSDYEDEIHRRSLDEPWWFTKKCKSAEKADAKFRASLADPKKARAEYQHIALLQTTLTHAEFRTLAYLLDKGDPDLTNSFPSQAGAAEKLGMTTSTYNAHLVALRKKGWVRTHEFLDDTGVQGNSGVQFMIPPGVLPLGERWEGPKHFPNHRGGEKRARNARRKGGRPRSESSSAVVSPLNNSTA